LVAKVKLAGARRHGEIALHLQREQKRSSKTLMTPDSKFRYEGSVESEKRKICPAMASNHQAAFLEVVGALG
jgi:hypothetical protein